MSLQELGDWDYCFANSISICIYLYAFLSFLDELLLFQCLIVSLYYAGWVSGR